MRWPFQSKIEMKNLSLKYSQNSALVIKDISFDIRESEKVAIVGRSGAGKTSIVMSLFRILEP